MAVATPTQYKRDGYEGDLVAQHQMAAGSAPPVLATPLPRQFFLLVVAAQSLAFFVLPDAWFLLVCLTCLSSRDARASSQRSIWRSRPELCLQCSWQSQRPLHSVRLQPRGWLSGRRPSSGLFLRSSDGAREGTSSCAKRWLSAAGIRQQHASLEWVRWCCASGGLLWQRRISRPHSTGTRRCTRGQFPDAASISFAHGQLHSATAAAQTSQRLAAHPRLSHRTRSIRSQPSGSGRRSTCGSREALLGAAARAPANAGRWRA
jgi:hypothetical protein